MKIVIPTENDRGLKDKVAEHFGRCQTYTFINEKGEIIEIIKNTSEHMGGSGLPPELMKSHNAQVLLCRGLGPRALNLCQEMGIEVYSVMKKESFIPPSIMNFQTLNVTLTMFPMKPGKKR